MSDKLLELGYEMSVAYLKDQDETLSKSRDRSVTMLSASTIAVSLAANAGLVGSTSTEGSTTPTWMIIALFVPSILIASTTLYALRPVEKWTYGLSPATFVKAHVEGVDESQFRQQAIEAIMDSINNNEAGMRGRFGAARFAVGLLVAQLAFILIIASTR